MTFYLLLGLFLIIGIIIFSLVKLSKKLGIQQEKRRLQDQIILQSRQANEAEITVDNESDDTLRNGLRSQWGDK